ncbi:MAG: hypothetical protein NTW86_15725 [Candidatus Sumerlaeota bacterium]|nr:hypothetical protein [Candidatus Sumerlaeota bacterium]
MIRINLLPEELTGRRARAAAAGPPPSWLVFVPIVLFVLVDVFLFWKVFNARSAAAAATKSMQAELADKEKTRDSKLKSFQELRDLKAKLDNQIEILRQLDPPDRILWSEKLNMLALAITPEAFITELTLTEKVTEVETEESIKRRQAWDNDKSEKKGPAPKEVKVPIITQTLAINVRGHAVGRARRVQVHVHAGDETDFGREGVNCRSAIGDCRLPMETDPQRDARSTGSFRSFGSCRKERNLRPCRNMTRRSCNSACSSGFC